MKKFAKIMALALALCMVMSVAAFAASPSTPTLVDQKLNVSVVTGGTSDEQVALLILKAGATIGSNDTDIVYVGQMAATSGTAAFNGITIKNDVDAVDIYAGSATYAANNNNTYDLVAEGFELTTEITDVAVVMGTVTKVNSAISDDPNANLYGSAVSAEFTFTLPTNGVTVTDADMIWSLRSGSTVKYTKPIDITSKLPAAGLEGAVRLSVAFANGTKAGETVQEITGASAIFKFVRSDKTQELVLDPEDEANDARKQG